MNTLCFLNLSLLILSDLISVTGAEISQSACDSYNDWGSAGSTKLLGSKIHFMTLNQIAMHDRVICTCTPESYIHALHILGSYVHAIQGHTYMHSGVILTCPLESGLWGHIYLQSRAILACPVRSYIHALWSLGSYVHAIQLHTYMHSRVIHTCHPG